MTHLGDRVSALVDGQLSADAVDRAHAHLAGCRTCRDAVEVERLIKGSLCGMSDPILSDDLVARLVALGGPSGPLPPRPGYVPGSPRPVHVPVGAPEPVRLQARRVGAALFVSDGGADDVTRTESGLLVRAAGHRLFAGRTLRSARSRPTVDAGPGGSGGPGRSTRPGRSTGPGSAVSSRIGAGVHRVRFAGVVLGALGVVGVGIGGMSWMAGAIDGHGSSTMDSLTVRTSTSVPVAVRSTGLVAGVSTSVGVASYSAVPSPSADASASPTVSTRAPGGSLEPVDDAGADARR